MNRSKLLAGAALFAAMVGAPAFAASSDDIHGVQSAKMSLSDAIASAEKADSGKAIFGKYETKSGAGNYVVTVVANGRKDTLNVDPQTGNAVKADVSSSGSSSEAGAQTIENAKVGLTQAIDAAEQKAGGKAMRATLDTEKDRTAYKVELANGDKSSTVWIDATTGKVLDKS